MIYTRLGYQPISRKAMSDQSSKPPYTFRAFWAILLLAINFYVAYVYSQGIS
jgi:hypothetical protein